MKIFLPFQQDLNPYLEEIINCSLHCYKYGNYKDYSTDFDIVNIHWPEAIFNWIEPTPGQLLDLEEAIETWKKHSILIYTKHDFGRNKGMTPSFEKLFKLVEQESDVFIHLGKYSRDYYKERYPEKVHVVIEHPLYRKTFRIPSIDVAREKLGISKGAIVFIVPGNIRTFRERNIVLNAFKGVKLKDKVLIATNMRSEIRWDFRGRVRLKKIFDLRNFVVEKFKKKHSGPNYLFTYEQLDVEELALKMAASDIVLIPRINTLNSGILFLGLTFGKIIVGPAIGNIKEHLKEFNFPMFDPNSDKSARVALEEAVELLVQSKEVETYSLNKYEPNIVAGKLDNFFKTLKCG